jgi:hypothetical protein
MEFFSIIALFFFIFCGVKSCSDSSDYSRNIKSQKEFYHEGLQYQCHKTEKQKKIDKLKEEMDKVRE